MNGRSLGRFYSGFVKAADNVYSERNVHGKGPLRKGWPIETSKDEWVNGWADDDKRHWQ